MSRYLPSPREAIAATTLLLLYISPALVATGVFVTNNGLRLLEITEQLEMEALAYQGPDVPLKAEGAKLNALWAQYLATHWTASQGNRELFLQAVSSNLRSKILHEQFSFNVIMTMCLTLLPGSLLGFGFAFRRKWTGPFLPQAQLALQDWGIKFLVQAVMAFGIIYFFNPFGQGASTVYGLLKYRDLFSKDSLPIYLDATAPVRPVLVGFLGWYMHLLGYFAFRLYRLDVVSTRVYGIVFRHLIFVMGLSVSFTLTGSNELLFTMFLVGYLPMSALGLLKQVLLSKIPRDGDEELSLLVLPNITRFEVLRLEEEGVDNVSALLTANLDKLKASLPMNAGLLELWHGAASLICVVGIAKYREMKELCLTGAEFVRRVQEPAFRELLQSKAGLANPDELAVLIRSMRGGNWTA
ncbi:hypothetical protein [Hyalangium versicolor]|uniref:hypothetical protein n=1 Tax=Hyalangium versicolor TaxID=2861190 RepID=UPI001CC986D3|nr:hypothetical protein [Hyalangium versicolor]